MLPKALDYRLVALSMVTIIGILASMLLIIPAQLDAQEPSNNGISSEPSYCYIFVVGWES